MKKFLSLMLVFALVLSLAACGSGTKEEPTTKPADDQQNQAATEEIKPEEGAKLVLWESGGAVGEWAKFVAQEFEKKYGVPVKFEEVGHTDAPKKLQTDGPAGLGADVFAAPHDHLGELVSAGLVMENFWPEEYKKDYMDAAITGTTFEGTLYGYPSAIETYGLFYNKDLVKTLPETWDELIAQSKEFTDKNAKKYGFMMEVSNFYFVYSLMGGYGGYVFGNNNTDPSDIGLNNEGSVKAGELLQRIHNEILPLKNEDITYDIKQSLFNEGKLMFNLDGPWAVDAHRQAGVNFGVMPLPKLDNGEHPTSFSGIRALYVNAYTKYPNAASLLAQFATSEENLLKFFEMTGMLPPRTALLDNEQIKNDEIASAFLEQAQYAVPMPNIPQMPSVWEPMGSALSIIWNEGANVKETLDKGVQQIKDAIATQDANK
ncbi:extracellular solute-binding protein [Tepidibacillus infernus]|uniref:Maltodextrin-binding protein n=1 Tax=Tepidibacillus decaturensis TaxID=1413211 RepID=A0A135L5V8_9BACI|nr:maltose ABC transporter substrate-binding protein [Tepidibacillus decaturensis]KXG44388.1 ABC transporter substrate-binding protein [Tepidibacillus decaturensis]